MKMINSKKVERPAWQEVLKWVIVGLATSLLLMFTQQSAAGSTIVNPDKDTGNAQVKLGETVNDDVYIAGGDVKILGNVNGDLVVGGGTVNVSGNVSGDVIAAGGDITITGNVGDDLRIAGGTVRIDGPVKDGVMATGGTVVFTSKARIGGDIMVAGGTIDFDGVASKRFNAAGGTITISGRVDGDVNVYGTALHLADTAVIGKNLSVTTQKKLLKADGAKILGTVTEKIVKVDRSPILASVVGFLFSLLGMIVVGIVLLALLGKRSVDFSEMALGNFGKSVGWGALILIATPVAILIAMFTLIGIPLAIITALIYGIGIYLAQLFSGLAIGTLIFKLTMPKSKPNTLLSFLVGIVILSLLMAIPFVGWLFSLVAILWGLGALVMTKWNFLAELKGRKIGR